MLQGLASRKVNIDKIFKTIIGWKKDINNAIDYECFFPITR